MMESRIELKIFSSDIMLNYHLYQKFKHIEISKFINLINISSRTYLTISTNPILVQTELKPNLH